MLEVGSQLPRICIAPEVTWSEGDDAAFLAASYGLKLDPWQDVTVVRDWLGIDANGKLLAGKCGLAVPRQNGKNGALEAAELYKMVVQGRKILHTAHEVKTARKAFTRMKSFFENKRKYPELAAMVVEIRRTNGQEAIYLNNGGSIEYIARSRGSGRGFTVDDLVCDECQDLTDEQLEALLPTISSAPSGDPQWICLGTPPGPRSPGEVFPRLRKQALTGEDKRVVWHEWSIPDDLDPVKAIKDWKALAYLTNPGLGIRLHIQVVSDELSGMSPEGFCRERLGQWAPENQSRRAIPLERWRALYVHPDDVPEGRVCYAVKFSADGATVGLAAAIRPDGPSAGRVHVEAIRLVNMGEGISELVDWLADRHRQAAQIVIDGRAGVGYMVNALKDAGVRNKNLIWTPQISEVTAAHSMMDTKITNGQLSTVRQIAVEEQVKDAAKRPIGKDGGFGWAPALEDGSVVLLDAMTLAQWAAATTKRKPGRKAVPL